MSTESTEKAHPAQESAASSKARTADLMASLGHSPQGSQPDEAPEAADLRLLQQYFPRSIKGMGRHIDAIMPAFARTLGPRHSAALRQLAAGSLTVGLLAKRLDVTLSTASGLLADLDRESLIVRAADPADRRRTIVDIHPDRRADVDQWLSDFARPLRGVLAELDAAERAAFVKAMQLFAEAVAPQGEDDGPAVDCGA